MSDTRVYRFTRELARVRSRGRTLRGMPSRPLPPVGDPRVAQVDRVDVTSRRGHEGNVAEGCGLARRWSCRRGPLPQILTPGACPAGAAVHFGVRGHGGLRRY
jgi:hypothetical protein